MIQLHKKHVELLEEKGEVREYLGIIKGWRKGVIRGKKVLAKTGGTARHTKMNEVKSYVIEEWNLHRLAYKNNKSEFSRIYARIISTKFQKQDGSALSVTEKTIRDVWLRDTPSAS